MPNSQRDDRILLQRRQVEQLRKTGAPTYQHAHRAVAHVAKELANVFYEEAAHDNHFYNYYPSREFFVEREWHLFIQQARACMAQQLNDAKTAEGVKADIFEALTLDRQLPRPDNANGSMVLR